jgi:hypothetical protein
MIESDLADGIFPRSMSTIIAIMERNIRAISPIKSLSV